MSASFASPGATSTSYQAHIDGLRAIAVLSVLFFHLGWTLFPGGFVGVDVFFVISGYLITRLLVTELDNSGDLSLKHFYIRRVRRLLPAFLLMLLIVTGVAALLFSPVTMQRFGNSLTYAVVGLSNYVFWLEADYFDVSANVKPLLHTWSLSVEEQFYLVWPSLLLLLHSKWLRRFVPGLLALIGLGSLYLNFAFADGDVGFTDPNTPEYQAALNNAKATLFFLAPFRVFEFVIGALLVWAPANRLSMRTNSIALWTALLMIGAAVLSYHEGMLFPSYVALLPCLGTALAIYCGGQVQRFNPLVHPAMTRVGLWSYSLYLYHWPIIVFWVYLKIVHLTPLDYLGIVILSFVCAYLSYRYVELPFRRAQPIARPDLRKLAVVGSVMALTLTGTHIYQSQGWSWRAPALMPAASVNGGADYPIVGNLTHNEPVTDIIMVGDSHGNHYAEGLHRELAQAHNLRITMHAGLSCFHLPGFTRTTVGAWDSKCPAAVEDVIARVKRQSPPPIVILSHAWASQLDRADLLDQNGEPLNRNIGIDDVLQGLARFKQAIGDAPLLVIGQVPTTNGLDLQDLLTRPDTPIRPDPVMFATSPLDPAIKHVNQALRAEALRSNNYAFLDPTAILCKTDVCVNVNPQLQPLYSDLTHLSKLGSRLVIGSFVRHGGVLFGIDRQSLNAQAAR